ncbi:hypothetical protein pipiens_015101 [Culex pipiens pipiens]|uniref:Uncharacterized protein n=1 Tax=Culex pipiens pipiens TaxID=38569 RepID=A0ABD1CRW0_CULPP
MSISIGHGQQQDDPRSGWLVLPVQQSSSPRTQNGQQPPSFVSWDDLDAPAKQPLFDYRPQGGLECEGRSLPTPEELFRRRLPKQDQLINGKSEQQHTTFAATASHMEGAMEANAASSSAPKQADREFEVRSNSCEKMPCHEASKQEFAGDWVIKCQSSYYSEEGHQVDTKQSRNSVWERWHTTAYTIKRVGARFDHQRLNKLCRIPSPQISPIVYHLLGASSATGATRTTSPSAEAGPSDFTGSVSPKPSSPLRNVLVKNQIKSPSSTSVSDQTQWTTTSPFLNCRKDSQSPKLSTRKLEKAIQPDRDCLVVNYAVVSRTVKSSKRTKPSAAARLPRWSHRLYGRQRCTTTASHLDTAASETQLADYLPTAAARDKAPTASGTCVAW